MCPPSSQPPKDTNNKNHPSISSKHVSQSIIWLFPRSFLLPRNQLSRGYSFFPKHRRPKSVLPSRARWPRKQFHQFSPTFMGSFTPPDHFMFHMLQRTLLQRELLQKVIVITPTIKGKISAVTRDHNVQIMQLLKLAWPALPMKALQVYIRWEIDKKDRWQPREKKREGKNLQSDFPLNTKNSLPLVKFHCILQQFQRFNSNKFTVILYK